jgi:drug/metabolite transporter (DMT)-like permease
MKLSKLLHVISVFLGLTGLVLWAVAILASSAFGQTREVMLLCAALSFLTAIWLVLGAMHHNTLEKTREIV